MTEPSSPRGENRNVSSGVATSSFRKISSALTIVVWIYLLAHTLIFAGLSVAIGWKLGLTLPELVDLLPFIARLAYDPGTWTALQPDEVLLVVACYLVATPVQVYRIRRRRA